jgi:hypothetical protein
LNVLPPEKADEIKRWLAAGASFRQVMASLGVAKQTVQRYRDMLGVRVGRGRSMKQGFPRLEGGGIVSRAHGKTLSLGRDIDARQEFIVCLSSRSAGRIERLDGLDALRAIHEFVRLYRAHIT